MNKVLSEKEYQQFIMERLEQDNGYVIRTDKDFNRLFALDQGMFFKFLSDTQPETMADLKKIYKADLESTIINLFNNKVTSKDGSLIYVLKNGLELSNKKIELMYTKPATNFNKELMGKYKKNIFSVAEEVWASDKERVDLVIFLNGIAIMSFELKCNAAGQSYEDAIYQYRTQRNPKTRLFLFKAGCLVNFAMDLEEVYMTTRLNKENTDFKPFNMGRGHGVNSGAGNPIYNDKYSVFYMWKDILKKDTILDLIGRFIFIEVKEDEDEASGKKKKTEKLIFPRYHQIDALRKIMAEVYTTGTAENYLIQHSAGSGKTKTIAWLAYRLASLHDAKNKIIFDNIIVVTDRIVVDRQLQRAIMDIEHKAGLVKVMDEKCSSADLKTAIEGPTKITATTIQKFPFIVDVVKDLKKKRFAVIIDEAHSSTSGKDMAAITKSLGKSDEEFTDAEDIIVDDILRHGKQENVSIFGFTATPKPTTLQMLGKLNSHGKYEAFHTYSMKQAIEEGFILDVLKNYTCYDTFYRINKVITDDPKYKTNPAKRKIARYVKLHDTNISQRIEIIIEHFRTTVMDELGGTAKAMVITSSRQEAVRYRQAFEDYIQKKNYSNIHALVAFSGKVKFDGDDTEYTESGMNNFSEARLPKEFDVHDYQVLIVANKYQTGFDQPKLCAMYILKKLKNVAAVQTLSRLNRICPPYEKETFILDFINDYKTIVEAFKPYFTTTILANTVTPEAIYELEAKIEAYTILDPEHIEKANEILLQGKASGKDKQQLNFYFTKSKNQVLSFDQEKQKEIIALLHNFIRFYQFLIQVSCFKDIELHKKYMFISCLISFLNINHPGPGFNLDGKISAFGFVQKEREKHKKSSIVANPFVHLPSADKFGLPEDKEEKLSKIIGDINSRTGKAYDEDVAVKALLQIHDILMKSEKLKISAKNNTRKDFEFSYYEDIDDALITGLEQNQDFFTLLLNNKEIKHQVLGIFAGEIYNQMHSSVKNDLN